jgi:hypothetical protein
MHILDQDSDKALGDVILYLTLAEALELRDGLNELIKKPLNNHTHVSDENYQRELTVCIYDKENLEGFNKRSINLITHDE